MEKVLQKKSKLFIWISYAYILLPFLIFAVGWFGKRYWVPMIPILLFCYWKACRDSDKYWMPEFTKDNVIKIIFIVFVIFVWVYYSGIGRLVFQNMDHNYRNAVYEVLVQREWPIINYDIMWEHYPADTKATSLVYYIGFWLPAAVFGKVFGIEAGYVFQVLWAIIGIFLVYYFICARKEKLMIWPLAILIFFSGLDILGKRLVGIDLLTLSSDAHLEWWMEPYQFSSNTTQLYWVYNQAIPAWLCTMLAWLQKKNRSIVFILACCMLSSTLPFVGLVILVLFWMVARTYAKVIQCVGEVRVKQFIIYFIKDTFTIQNVVGGGIIGIFSFLYLSGNLAGNLIMTESTKGAMFESNFSKYLLFIIVEVGVYIVVLFRYNKSNSLFYAMVLSLLLVPQFRVGMGWDFCMRASIPALFLLMNFVIDALERANEEKHRSVYVFIIVLLCIGAITPLNEFTRSVKNTIERVNKEEQIYETAVEDQRVLNASNFSGRVDNDFFFKYIAR